MILHGSVVRAARADAYIVDALAAAPAFASFDRAMLRSLAASFTRVRCRAGEVVLQHDSSGDELYVVVYGRLRVVLIESDGAVRVLGEVGRGGLAGEMAVLTGKQRIGSVVALRDSELLRLDRRDFEALAAAHSPLLLAVTRTLVSRYHASLNAAQPATVSTVALLPTEASPALSRVAGDLVSALRAQRQSVRHIDPERGAVMRDGVSHSASARLLSELEAQHDLVVYEAAAGSGSWNSACVRQADTVVVLARTNSPADMPAALRSTSGGALARRIELVLVRDPRTEPAGTEAWLDVVAPDAHYHVEAGSVADGQRVARCVLDTGIGLVLGGGGARGLAHIGVLRALEEARIEIDRVGGTSAGANIGAMHASGWDWRRILEETRRTFVDGGSLQDYTLPLHSLLGGRRYHRIGERLYGDRRIEDMRLPFFCVSTNLTRGNACVHRTGLVRRAVRASMTVPGIAPAVFEGREVLVDGGVVNNLPVDVMRAAAIGTVIAVNVSPRRELRLDADYPDTPSPWRTLARRLLGRPTGIPTLTAVLTRAASIPRAAMEADPRRRPDLLLEPPVAGFRLLQWSAIDQLVEIGYRHAAKLLADWQRPS
jgi:predicted acylesterase/phospholipase RssA/CRP-like cAMP-binding protein